MRRIDLIFNKTKTRFGEKLLRGWFARPTQDLDTLRERHDAIEFLTAAPNAQLHAQLHGLVGKMKDISKIESSLSRGGLLLSDYTATLATASYAVKVAEMLLAAEVPQTLPFVRRALAAIDRELYMVSNTIASVIDFEASGAARSKAMVGGSHIVVREGVEALLDKLREEYAEITPVLDAVAAEERGRLARIGRLPPSGELYLVYVAQLGFLLRLPLPAMDAAEAEAIDRDYREHAGLSFLFDDAADADEAAGDGTRGGGSGAGVGGVRGSDWYCKCEACEALFAGEELAPLAQVLP